MLSTPDLPRALILTACALLLVLGYSRAIAQEERPTELLFSCDTLEGVVVRDGATWPETVLELNRDPRYISEGNASLHLRGVSPADATGNSYLSVEVPIGGVDLTGQAILFEAWTDEPENTKALYVRGYDAAGQCVLSFLNWSGPLGDGTGQTFELVRAFSDQLAWEPAMVQSDDLTAVQTLRFWIGTSQPGVPFSLYLDNIRMAPSTVHSFTEVTEPKALVRQTPVVEGGQPRATIIAPADEGWRAVASEVQAGIRELTGAELPIVSADEITDEAMRATTAIVLGNVVNNRRMLYLYAHRFVYADDIYPGAGGYEVRTVHDPWGTGMNVLSIGASDIEGARAGVTALRAGLAPGRDLMLDPTFLVELSPEARRRWGAAFTTTLDDAWFERLQQQAERDIESGAHTGLMSRVASMGEAYALTQRDGYARAFVWLVLRAKAHRDTNPPTYGGPWGMDSDFTAFRVLPAWDVVEESPELSDDERMEVTQALFEWVTDAVASEAASSMGANRPRHNHNTYAALGSYFAGEYFGKYYDAGEAERWLAIADDCFQDQAQYFKAHEDCNGYQWLTLYHMLRYALSRPDFTIFENGNARRLADYAIMSMDNFGYSVTYGDTGAYVGWWSELPVLHAIEWYYRDGRAAWALEKKIARSGRLATGEFATRSTPAAPSDLIGALAFPLDPGYYRALGGPNSLPEERAFDKVVFRSGFEPEDDYLLLDGLNNGGHQHYDGNSISRITANGRIWLADASYMDSLPKYHSTALILRDGQSGPLPGFAEMEHLRDLPDVGFSETALKGYAGVDWHRNIFWLKDEWFLVADEMTAQEAGDYSFRMLWHTLGEVRLGEDGLDVEQQGRHFAIRMTPELRFTLEDDADYGANWRGYEFAEPVVRKLTGIWNGRLEEGETVTLFTLLHPSGEEASALRLRRLGPNQVAVVGEPAGPTVVAVGEGGELLTFGGQAEISAHAALLRPGLAALFDATRAYALGQGLDLPGSDLQIALGEGDLISYPVAGRTATPAAQRMTEFYPEVAALNDAQIRAMLDAAIASAPPVEKQPMPGGEAPALGILWSYGETLDSYLLTGNRGAFAAVDTGLQLSATPEPLARNVFAPAEETQNTVDNIVDGGVDATADGVMWDDDQPVTVSLDFDAVYDLDAIDVRAWFATSSSKGKLFQVGAITIEASDDGFMADRRTIVEFTDEEMHGNWGAPAHAPQLYRFADLNTHARNLRLTFTPRPGTAIYLAEIEVWGTREGIEALAAQRGSGVPVHSFIALHAVDLDGDGADEIIAGSENGKVYLFESDGSVAWEREIGGRVLAVSAVRFAGQERPVVVAGGTGATLYAFTATGDDLWQFAMPTYHGTGVITTLFPADLNGDGNHAVIAGTQSWRYYAFDESGKEIWRVESVRMSRVGTAADLDGDGQDEVIAGTEYHSWPVYDSDGTRLFSYAPRTGPGMRDVATADLTGDGLPEIIFAGQDSFVHVVAPDGKLLWKFGTGDEVTSVTTVGPADGPRNVIAGSRSFNLYAFSGDGTVLWRNDLGSPVLDVAALRTAAGELVAAVTADGIVFVADATTGAAVARHTLIAPAISVIAADLDGDGTQEIVVSSRDGNLTALR